MNYKSLSNKYFHLLKPFGIIALTLLIFSCTTKKNTPVTRTYHNITSRFNVLFNGKESFKSGVKTIEENFKDDYTQVLPVFTYGNAEVNASASSEMERALKKTSKLISMHSITVKPELKSNKPLSAEEKAFYDQNEFNKWVDDNYLLMGKAYFYRNEYGPAKETFRFMLREFPEKEIIYDAKLWLARTLLEGSEYREANAILSELEYDEELPKHLKLDLYTTLTDYQLKLKNYKLALPYLEESLDQVRKKKDKIRYTFILAQVNAELENFDKASELFRDVIKMNPPYEMAFQAKINRALSFQSAIGGAINIKNELRKMLKDDKNIEFQDQIYFALGEIEYKQGNIDAAMDYFRKSINASVDNYIQKAYAYLTMADIYYIDKQYLEAQAFYDSAVVLIDNDFPDYENILVRSTSLTKLADHVNTFNLQDSVLKLSKLPEQELMTLINKIIQDVVAQEQEQKYREQQRLQQELLDRQAAMNNRLSLDDDAGSWYFYNQNTKDAGEREFKLKWGNRKLEDHWRRKNKQVVSFADADDEGDGEEGEVESAKDTLSNKDPEYYLIDIPFTDSMKTASHFKIKNALFNMGLVYRTDLEDYPQAISAFEELIKRYPKSELALPSYYNLYDIYRETNRPVLAQAYRDRILSEYPDSKFALIISDPNYAKRIEEQENQVNNLYERVYTQYRNAQYSAVLAESNRALQKHKSHELAPNFAFLRTMAVGYTQSQDNFKAELENYIKNYPRSELAQTARETLKRITKGPVEDIFEEQEVREIVQVDYLEPLANDAHFVAIVTDKKANINQLVFNVITFNLDNYDRQNLVAEQEALNDDENLVLVKQFKSKREAQNYYNTLVKYPELFKDVDNSLAKTIIISVKNYTKLLESKVAESYYPFFEQYYIQN